MARGSNQAISAANQAQGNAGQYNKQANELFSSLAPTLESEAAHPPGFSPTDEAALETGAMQTAGGTQAGAVGEGGLYAARTGNAGAGARVISDASRGAGEQLSTNLLGIRNASARLKEQQKQAGLSGLEGLTGLETGASTNSLGLVAPLLDVNLKAAEADPWNQFISGFSGAAGAGIGSRLGPAPK